MPLQAWLALVHSLFRKVLERGLYLCLDQCMALPDVDSRKTYRGIGSGILNASALNMTVWSMYPFKPYVACRKSIGNTIRGW